MVHGHEVQVEGVDVDVTGDKSWPMNYEQSDMQVVYRRVPHANSWSDLINWLEKHGEADNELSPGEAVALKADLSSLKNNGVPFTNNPDKAYEEACKYREQNRKAHPNVIPPGADKKS